jgi:hypothetical protein
VSTTRGAVPSALLLLGLSLVACEGDASTPGATASEDVHPGKATSTIWVSLEELEGLQGMNVSAWVLPGEPRGDDGALGGVGFEATGDPYSATDVMHQGTDRRAWDEDQLATFVPGTYRFIIEAYVSNGPMRYGCETEIRVDGDEPVFVRISSMPTYRGSGYAWIPADELRYPNCFATVTVVVRALKGERGKQLAGVLYRLDPPHPSNEGLGGFSAEIDSDPFSTTQAVFRGEQDWVDGDLAFPYVGDEVATLVPGRYGLYLWASRELGPYNRWLPGGGEDLKGCRTTFRVGEGEDATVVLTDPVLRAPKEDLRDCDG